MGYKGCGCDDCREYLRKQREDEEKQKRAEERANYVPTWADQHPKLFMAFWLTFCISMAIMCFTVLAFLPYMACMGIAFLMGVLAVLGEDTRSSGLTDDEALAIGVGTGIFGGLLGGGGFD